MIDGHTWTCLFYFLVTILAVIPFVFVWSIWHQAKSPRNWIWINTDSRTMYVDGIKTLITAAGVAVALLASSAVQNSGTTRTPLIAFSVKVAVVCLIICVALSIVVIFAILRSFETAHSRHLEDLKAAGQQSDYEQGKLSKGELLFILGFGGPGLSCFLVGFAFLGRIAFHF